MSRSGQRCGLHERNASYTCIDIDRWDLGDRFRNDTSTDSASTLTDCKLEALLERDGCDELEVSADVVTRHAHVDVVRKCDCSGDIRGPAQVFIFQHR